jgi:hypothetical protein
LPTGIVHLLLTLAMVHVLFIGESDRSIYSTHDVGPLPGPYGRSSKVKTANCINKRKEVQP